MERRVAGVCSRRVSNVCRTVAVGGAVARVVSVRLATGSGGGGDSEASGGDAEAALRAGVHGSVCGAAVARASEAESAPQQRATECQNATQKWHNRI